MKAFKLNNKGIALAYVLMVMAVLAIIGTIVLAVSFGETKIAITSEKSLQANYVAKAGADIAAEYMKKNPGAGNTTITDTFGEGSFTAVITKLNANAAKIEATGTVGTTIRKVTLMLKKGNYQGLFTGIRQTGEKDLNLSQFPITYPPDTTVTIEANGNITLASKNIGDKNIISTLNPDQLPPFNVPDTTYFETELPTDMTFKGNYNLPGTTLSGGYTFDTQDGDQHIVVDSINFKANEPVVLEGDGFVHLYLNKENSNSEIKLPKMVVNPGSTATIIIYVAKNSTLSFNAGCESIRAYIYGPQATISIQSSKTTIHGSIIGNIIDRGNPNGPHGNFDYIPLTKNPDDSSIDTSYQKAMYVK